MVCGWFYYIPNTLSYDAWRSPSQGGIAQLAPVSFVLRPTTENRDAHLSPRAAAASPTVAHEAILRYVARSLGECILRAAT